MFFSFQAVFIVNFYSSDWGITVLMCASLLVRLKWHLKITDNCWKCYHSTLVNAALFETRSQPQARYVTPMYFSQPGVHWVNMKNLQWWGSVRAKSWMVSSTFHLTYNVSRELNNQAQKNQTFPHFSPSHGRAEVMVLRSWWGWGHSGTHMKGGSINISSLCLGVHECQQIENL